MSEKHGDLPLLRELSQSLDPTSLKDLVKFVVMSLVNNPSDVHVEEVGGDQTVVFEVSVAKSDLGQVIGKSGQLVTSLRTILGGAGAKQGKRAVLEILE